MNNIENLTDDELERLKKMLDIIKMQQDIEKLNAETTRIQAETAKIQKESRYYPVVVFVGIGTMLGGLLVALGGFLAKFI